MSAPASPISPTVSTQFDGDRWGIVASVLCAIHCAVTPALFLFAPTFGELWSHPASHWIVALFVVPLAMVVVFRGFRIHRQKWVVACALLGVVLVVAGAIVPYWSGLSENNSTNGNATADAGREEIQDTGSAAATDDSETVVSDVEAPVVNAGDEVDEDSCATEDAACPDACCPSLIADDAGNTKLHVPTASVVTTLGGVVLICTHLGNLCACRKQKKTDCCESPFC